MGGNPKHRCCTCVRPEAAEAFAAGWIHRLPKRDHSGTTQLGREGLPQPHLLPRGRQGRALCRVGRAGAVCRRAACGVPLTALVGEGDGGHDVCPLSLTTGGTSASPLVALLHLVQAVCDLHEVREPADLGRCACSVWALRVGREHCHSQPHVEHTLEQSFAQTIEERLGTSGLSLFSRVEHSHLLSLLGKTSRATQYTIGNPLLALQMTRYMPEAALYAPLKLVVYEDEQGNTFLAYDSFVSQLAQYQREEITRVARLVEHKLEALVAEVTGEGRV